MPRDILSSSHDRSLASRAGDILRRRKMVVVLVFAAVVAAVGTFTRYLPDLYRASATVLVEPSASVEGHPASALHGDRPASATILIGPEGGWSGGEVASAVAAGYLPITLGRRTLRADAVPIVALGVLQYLWRDL